MSDDTTPGLREQIVSRLSQVWPYEIHLNVENNTNKIRGAADVVMDVVQPELDRLKVSRHHWRLAAEEAEAERDDYANRLRAVDRSWANLAAERDQLKVMLNEAANALREISKAAIVLQPNLDKPYPDAPDTTPWVKFMEQPARRAYKLATRIRRQLRAAPEQGDLPAVRDFAAKHDPRHVESRPTITELLDHAAELDRLRKEST